MTAIKMRAVAPAAQGKSRPLFLEVLCRSLIILCVALSVVLSSVAVCDGHWLLSDRRMFGLWFFCVVEDSGAAPNCSRHIGEGLDPGLCVCRSVVSLAVVSAIFGLELLVMSQVSEGRASSQRWHLGAWLVLLAAGFAAGGVATFVFLFWDHATPLGFTLTFWCQFTATFLFFLNGLAARHIQNMAELLPSSGHLGGKL
ncbi:voltage-dependent calcium channel gamma-like subunit [Colossoma macropomum]|uniref:voltage-dependent calcium channel gamma-like subunit n=1 Tax=Colossoma macropomum TaxID=42526 RepID=UPI0018649472|nr:voltage-dependent calcium channel gamma-like subunit [Colossoma macropomum]